MKNLKDKVVWLTGASSGIGEALAYNLANQGCKLVLSSRREKELILVKANCETQNPTASADRFFVLPLDLSEASTFAEKHQKVMAHFGRIDILLNNGESVKEIFFRTQKSQLPDELWK